MIPLQSNIQGQLQQLIGDILAFVPAVIGAIIVLIVGFIIGKVLGGIVARVIQQLGLGSYVAGTPLEPEGDSERRFARGLGKLVAYYVYFLAILAAANVLNIAILSQLLSSIAQYLPVILAAIVILIIGFIIGRVLGGVVSDVVGGFGLNRYLRDTPITRLTGERGVARAAGMVVEYYVYLITVLAAADTLNIPVLSQLLNTITQYVPALIGGLVVLVVGIFVAEFVEDIVRDAGGRGTATNLTAVAVKVLVYYITVTLALGMIGFDTTVLTSLFTAFVAAFFGALAIALAIGVGVGVGLGSKDYVANNIDEWADQAKSSLEEGTDTDSGSNDRLD